MAKGSLTKRVLVTIFFLLSCFTSVVSAEVSSDVSKRIKQIQGIVSKTQAKLKELTARQRTTEKRIKELEVGVEKLRPQTEQLASRLVTLRYEREEMQVAVSRAEINRQQAQARAANRLRAIYMSRGLENGAHILDLLGSNDPERALVYLARIQKFDRELVTDLRDSAKDAATKRSNLDTLLQSEEKTHAELIQKRTDLQAQIKEGRALVSQLEGQRKESQLMVTALNQEAERLEIVIASLTMDAEPVLESQPTPLVKPLEPPPTAGPSDEVHEEPAEPESESTVQNQPEEFFFDGLFQRPHAHPRPVEGAIVQTFGKRASGEFEDLLFSKGISFKASAGSSARAIADGRIAFSGEMPDYGIVVVIDHGVRSHSLYGRLAMAVVAVGDSVHRGGVVGEVGAADERGRSLYFEVRRGGKVVNPAQVLK